MLRYPLVTHKTIALHPLACVAPVVEEGAVASARGIECRCREQSRDPGRARNEQMTEKISSETRMVGRAADRQAADRLIVELGRRIRARPPHGRDAERRTADIRGTHAGPRARSASTTVSAVWRIVLAASPARERRTWMALEQPGTAALHWPSLPSTGKRSVSRAGGSGCRCRCRERSRIAPDETRWAGSRRNITPHYDLGNDFYRLFLDETLTYSTAVFASPDQSLADAQRNKYRVIAERAGLHAA